MAKRFETFIESCLIYKSNLKCGILKTKIILFFLISITVKGQSNSIEMKSFGLEKHFQLLNDKKSIDDASKEILDIEENLKIYPLNLKTNDSLKWKLKYFHNFGWKEVLPTPVKKFNDIYKAENAEIFTTKEILQDPQVRNIDGTSNSISLLSPRVQAKSIIATENYLVVKILFRYLHGNQTSWEYNKTYYFERCYK